MTSLPNQVVTEETRRLRKADWGVCWQLLPQVSRTFALTIRVLPKPLRESVTVSYLMCRLADSVEDATGQDPALRTRTLQRFAESLENSEGVDVLHRSLGEAERLDLEDAATTRLLAARPAVFRSFRRRDSGERQIISRWVGEMARGMAEFVDRELHPVGTDNPRYCLQTIDELRSYAYYVAGTVGNLLHELFQLCLNQKEEDEKRLRELAVPFGLGLQFVNIIQDMADDRRRGWSYVPRELARRHGTTLQRLGNTADLEAGRRVVKELAHEAAGYLDQAIEFTLLLPRTAPRIRLFCLWPIFFALRTLRAACLNAGSLLVDNKVKITRQDVREIIRKTTLSCLASGRLRSLYATERRALQEALDAL